MTMQEVRLGVGETATVRRPTAEEQREHGIDADAAVLVVKHLDREAEVLPADGVTIAPRSYGMAP